MRDSPSRAAAKPARQPRRDLPSLRPRNGRIWRAGKGVPTSENGVDSRHLPVRDCAYLDTQIVRAARSGDRRRHDAGTCRRRLSGDGRSQGNGPFVMLFGSPEGA
jgi:hypothetical protein